MKWMARLVMCLFLGTRPLLKALGHRGNFYFLDMAPACIDLKDKPAAASFM